MAEWSVGEHVLRALCCQSSVVSAATGVGEVQHEPNTAPCLCVKFHGNTASPIHLHSLSGGFRSTVGELSSCHRDSMAFKP